MIEAIILGILQGLTEFIPVSSSAHLIIIPWFFGWTGTVNTLSFSVALHLGTLISLLLYFRKDWVAIFKTANKKDSLIWHIFIATIPAAAAGLLFHDQIQQIRSPLLITATLSFVAVLMILVERKKKTSASLCLDRLSRKDALLIGIAQAVALVPGISRSGITIVTGLARGYQRQASARFSFLLGTPIVAGAGAFEAKELILSHNMNFQPAIFLTGIAMSALTGYIAIKFLLRFLQNHTLAPFAYYRFLVAFVIIITIWVQR